MTGHAPTDLAGRGSGLVPSIPEKRYDLPILFSGLNPTMDVEREEVFGPVATLFSFQVSMVQPGRTTLSAT